MKPERFWVFAILVVLTRQLLCLSPHVRTGIFKIVKKHPKIRSCALKIFQKDEYNSGRVHELTGECEGLKGNLSNSKADDEGYAYVKKVSSKRVFLTPEEKSTPLTLTLSDLEYKKRRLEVVTDLNLQRTSVLLGDKPFIHNEEGVVWTLQRPYFDLDIYPKRNGGFEMFATVIPNIQACDQLFYVSGKKTRISFSFPTNSSIQVSLDNTGHCTFTSPINTQNMRHLIVPYDDVYALTENDD